MSEGVCEALTFMEWSTMVVPSCPEGGSHALQVCQHHTIRLRACASQPLCRVVRDWKNMVLATAPAGIRLKASRSHSAHEGGGPGRWAVRPRVLLI